MNHPKITSAEVIKKMNRYELIKKNENTIFQFIKNGIISYQIIRDIEIYENYLSIEETTNNLAKYILLGEEYELSHKRIEQIIYNMQKLIT